MTVYVSIETTEEPSIEDLSQRGKNRALKAAHKAGGDLWQRKFLPRHFTAGAHARYGNYQRRRFMYAKRKRALSRRGVVKKGGRIDLVYTGTLEQMMTRHQVVKAYPSRATIRIPGPSYISGRPRDPRKPHMANEITAVSAAEHHAIRQEMSRAFAAAIANERTRKTTRT